MDGLSAHVRRVRPAVVAEAAAEPGKCSSRGSPTHPGRSGLQELLAEAVVPEPRPEWALAPLHAN